MSRKWLATPFVAIVALGFTVIAAVTPQPPREKPSGAANQQTKQKKKKAAQGTAKAQGKSVPPRSAAEAGLPVLSTGDSYDDFPSLAQAADGTLYVAYTAYFDGHDQIRLHKRLPGGAWSTHTRVPLVEALADIWMPQLAVDAADRLWVIWSEQTGRAPGTSGNWDLYARSIRDHVWGPTVRLTDDPRPDINHHVARDAHGKIYVVWQAHPRDNGDIQLCWLDGDQWSKPVAITSDSASDWYPQVALDAKGTAWIAFDSFRNGDYDVFLTSYDGHQAGPLLPVATSKYYEAHASVACADGRVWVAWERGGFNWGKDQGYWLRVTNRQAGTALGSERTAHVAAFHDGKIWAAPPIESAMPEGERQGLAMAGLATGPDGRLWLRLRHRKLTGGRRYWTEFATWLGNSGWRPATELPGSAGRISVFSRMLPAPDGSLHVAYSSDGRQAANFHQPLRDTVWVANLPKPEDRPATPDLAVSGPPDAPPGMPAWDSKREEELRGAIGQHRCEIAGKPHRIVRGDLHRHTELSWDVGPGNDGSYLDFYRYMIDVAAMDFGGLSDHQGGGHYPYWWWLTEKSCDLYYLPTRFVPLYGYERSVRYPQGHRNIFHSSRGVPVFPFQLKLDQTGVFPGVATEAVVDNDTKLLYEYLHRTGGVAMSHTSGTSTMGTDWRDNDPAIEPVVEIYQGARNSYEVLGGPRVHDPDNPPTEPPGGFTRDGLVWNAWAKGYRLGIIASSDHGSTHISYALVHVADLERTSILQAMRQRHTYGATDNLIVDFRANGRFMGEEFATRDKPVLELTVSGTAKIARVDLIRNHEYIYSREPADARVQIRHVDDAPRPGLSMYYFRLLQTDGEVAWTSPVWVKFEGQ